MIIITIFLLIAVYSRVYIDQFGAISGQDTVEAQRANSDALKKAILFLNSS